MGNPRFNKDYLPPRYANEDLDVPTVIRDRRFINFACGAAGQAQSN
jgi:hypothetical protein